LTPETSQFRLRHELVERARPERLALVLHGVFGSGQNWRSFANGLVAARPDWGFVLVDLRGHGRSQGAPVPHDLGSASDDLVRLEAELDRPVRGVIGHSFGGKTALAYAAKRHGALEQVWVLDSQPGSRTEPGSAASTVAVLELLEALPPTFPDRASFVRAVESAGMSPVVAGWLAMSVRPGEGGHRLQLDLPALRSLLDDYWRTDFWPELERHDARRTLHVVAADQSPVLSEADRARLAANPNVRLHIIERAGHWLHIDAPIALRDLIAANL
jgi:pimeloyl-ACP methyl ester carboxylesterase